MAFTVQTDITPQKAQHWLLAIVAASVVLRVAAALYMGDKVVDLPGIFDQISYDRLAQNILAGNGFSFDVDWWPATRAGEPTAHWSFVSTLYLAGVYRVFGHHPLVARLIQAVVAGVLLPWLTYALASRAANRTVGLAAAGISAIYIYFFYYTAALMTEAFFLPAVVGSLVMATIVADRPGLGRLIGLGVVSGTAILLRQTFLLFLPFLLLWVWWAGRKRVRWYHLLVPLLVAGLMVLPWTIRNYLAFHQFVLLNTNAGYVLFWSNHPIHGTSFIALLGPNDPSYHDLIPPELLSLDEAAMEKALLARGVQFVFDDPGRYVLLSLSRIQDYFLFWPRNESSMLSNVSRVGSFGLFLPFMLYGIVLAILSLWRRRRHLAGDAQAACLVLLLLFVAIYTLVHLLTWAYVRYRLPVDTVLVVFAAVGLVDLAYRAKVVLARHAKRFLTKWQDRL